MYVATSSKYINIYICSMCYTIFISFIVILFISLNIHMYTNIYLYRSLPYYYTRYTTTGKFLFRGGAIYVLHVYIFTAATHVQFICIFHTIYPSAQPKIKKYFFPFCTAQKKIPYTYIYAYLYED